MADQSSASTAEAIDISSTDHTVAIANPTGLYVGGAGNVKVDLAGTSAITLTGVLAGTLLPIQVTKVYKTGTTATTMTAVGTH